MRLPEDAPTDIIKYFNEIIEEFNRLYAIAEKAKSKGVDPKKRPEAKPVYTAADRVEGLLGIKGLSRRISELLNKLSKEEVAFKIAEEIILGRFGKFTPEEAADKAIRAAVAVLTDGITVAPLDGIAKVSIKKDGVKRWLAVYYAGPIRSAGGTEQALSVLVADYVRQLLHLDSYTASDEEAKRIVEEIRLHERYISRFQYSVSDEIIEKVVKHLPVQVTGIATDDIEVKVYKNVPNVEDNRIRGGAIRVINDGLIGKASKIAKYVSKLGLEGWGWIKSVEASRRREGDSTLLETVAGRPILSYPGMKGGFRLRYGRAINTGLAAVGINPATMIILDGFLATGSQIRIEGPGKSAIVLPVDSIDGPIVKLRNGDVVEIKDINDAIKLKEDVIEILYLGDILISYGEFLENNKQLKKPGICLEWWHKILIQKSTEIGLEDIAAKTNIKPKRLKEILRNPSLCTEDEAISLSKNLEIPLHPEYTFFWEDITVDEFLKLRKLISTYCISLKPTELEYNYELKILLEKIKAPHKLHDGKIILNKGKVLLTCIGYGKELDFSNVNANDVFSIIYKFSGIKVLPKAPTYIGARVGRPEKAKMRLMKPRVHVLFPVGDAGGSQRDLIKASKNREPIEVELNLRVCGECGILTFKYKCDKCNKYTIKAFKCPNCNIITIKSVCEKCGNQTRSFDKFKVNLQSLIKNALASLKIYELDSLKGVKGLISPSKAYEDIRKGILRAYYNLSVYKDGTIRIDIVNAPLTHFRPKDIKTNLKKLKELGYTEDYLRNPLTKDDQILELKIQDVILPKSVALILLKIAKFIDRELKEIYGEKPYYNAEKPEDLIGHLIVGLAPHTSVGVIGRIIGFTNAKVLYAHPVWHAAKRRNCDGDEDSLMLALDVLLNFSKEYLPHKIGGRMDAPLLLTIIVEPKEVDDEVYNMDISPPSLEFYNLAWSEVDPKYAIKTIEILEDRLNSPKRFNEYKFLHIPSNISGPVVTSTYVKLKTTHDKVIRQIKLMKKLKGIKYEDAIIRLLTNHFIPDIMGNLRKYFSQSFRCPKCSTRFRRIPLNGICPKCKIKVRQTVYSKSIMKYMSEALMLLEESKKLGNYYKQKLKLVERMVKNFTSKAQESLEEYI